MPGRKSLESNKMLIYPKMNRFVEIQIIISETIRSDSSKSFSKFSYKINSFVSLIVKRLTMKNCRSYWAIPWYLNTNNVNFIRSIEMEVHLAIHGETESV